MSSHQDWTTISIHNPAKLNANLPKEIVAKRGDTTVNDQLRKFDNDNAENFTVPTIPIALSKEIINARNSKKMTQKDISNKLSIQQNIYTELENGKAIYDGKTKQLIVKLETLLGVHFQNRPQK